MNQVKTLRLHEIAHARAGDKGNRLNISLIVYEEQYWKAVVYLDLRIEFPLEKILLQPLRICGGITLRYGFRWFHYANLLATFFFCLSPRHLQLYLAAIPKTRTESATLLQSRGISLILY